MSAPLPPPPPGAYPYPGPLPPARRHRRRWPWILLSVVALLVLAALLAPRDVKVGSAADQGAAGPDPVPTAKVGQKVHEGQLDLTVKALTYSDHQVGGTAAKGHWAVATILVRNVGQTPQTFYEDAQEAYVGQARYSPDSVASFGLDVAGGASAMALEMGPGNSTTVRLPFDIPKGKHLTRLVLHETIGSEGVEVRP